MAPFTEMSGHINKQQHQYHSGVNLRGVYHHIRFDDMSIRCDNVSQTMVDVRTHQCPGQFIGFNANFSFSTSNENKFSCNQYRLLRSMCILTTRDSKDDGFDSQLTNLENTNRIMLPMSGNLPQFAIVHVRGHNFRKATFSIFSLKKNNSEHVMVVYSG